MTLRQAFELVAEILTNMKNGEIREVSDASSIVHSLIHGESHDDNKVFFPDCGGNEK